jgi:hypothetical protein
MPGPRRTRETWQCRPLELLGVFLVRACADGRGVLLKLLVRDALPEQRKIRSSLPVADPTVELTGDQRDAELLLALALFAWAPEDKLLFTLDEDILAQRTSEELDLLRPIQPCPSPS